MRRLSSIIVILGLTINLYAQNPHSPDLKIDCAACHTSDSWEIPSEFWRESDPVYQVIPDRTRMGEAPASKGFNHASTEFPLSGQHTMVDCRACHEALLFTGTPTECYSCHTDMHNQTVGMDCSRCHNTGDWLVANITQLHYDNGFPLLGAHYVTDCYDCHISDTDLRFDRIGNDCINCHMDDYTATTNPSHVNATFSTNCIECHSINGFDWSSENINHEFFPLTLGHNIGNCGECHTSGDFSNTPNDCYSCHMEDYVSAVNPNHQNQNFSTDCRQCHTTDPDWHPVTFDHNQIYPLNGAHAIIANDCALCHNGDYNNTPTTCVGCHLDDYNNTTDPNHSAAQLPQDCQNCHTESAWEPSTFDHDALYFPIYTGRHAQEWATCADCHTSPTNYSVFSCIDCHEHNNQTDLADKHSEVQDYTYTSIGCYTCHPLGLKDD